MAKKKASAVQALTIALIIFVMCTFVLAVTTYVFYAQNEDAKVAKVAAEKAANEARQNLATAEQSQKELLEARIGVNEGDSIEAVDKDLAGLQEKAKKYGGEENATPTYRELIKTFDNALKSANRHQLLHHLRRPPPRTHGSCLQQKSQKNHHQPPEVLLF